VCHPGASYNPTFEDHQVGTVVNEVIFHVHGVKCLYFLQKSLGIIVSRMSGGNYERKGN
jgi:hypothetical protein